MDTLFFVVSKTLGALVRPDTWIALGFAAAVVGGLTGRRRLVLWCGGPVFLATLALGFMPLGDLVIRPLEARYPVAPPLDEVTGIIILGGAEQVDRAIISGLPQTNDSAERFIAGADLARRWPDARLVFTGGTGRLVGFWGGDTPQNAALATAILAELGIDPARVEVEGRSRNTAENAAFSRALVNPQPGETWVLVTSASHMPRAMLTFAAAGWPEMTAWPVDHRAEATTPVLGWDLSDHLQTLDRAVHEYVGLLAYRLSGRS